LCHRGRKTNRQVGITESGLEREKSHPLARPALLALLYFFVAVQSLFTDGANSPRLFNSGASRIQTEAPGLLDGSPLLSWPIIVIFRRKWLEYLPMHFCG